MSKMQEMPLEEAAEPVQRVLIHVIGALIFVD
jgi:hypothetical protein